MDKQKLSDALYSSVDNLIKDLEKGGSFRWTSQTRTGVDRVEIGPKIFEVQVVLESDPEEWVGL